MITALIVTYRSEKTIVECVRSARAAGVDQILIWDNSPSGGSRRAIESVAGEDITIFWDGNNHGFGGGVNRAVSMGDPHDELLLLNPDCLVSADAIIAMQKARLDGSAIVGVRMQLGSGEPGISAGPEPQIWKELAAASRVDDLLPRPVHRWLVDKLSGRRGMGTLWASRSDGPLLDVDWTSAYCMLLDRRTYDAVGGFDEAFFMYFEDVDFCVRAKELSLRVSLVRSVAVTHFESVSSTRTEKSKLYRDGILRYFEKHGNRFEIVVARLIAGRS